VTRAPRLALLAAALAGAAGCVPGPPFLYLDEAATAFEGVDRAYQVTLPRGWMRLNDDERLLVTRDGPTLQHIVLARRDARKPLERSKRTLQPGMEPFEVAELLAGELSSSERVTGVKVLETAPARVGGLPGFKLVVTYKDADGLRMRSVYYGALRGDWLWSLAYTAPARHYFERDLPTFQKVVASLRFAPAS
jgi:hypothetical protein